MGEKGECSDKQRRRSPTGRTPRKEQGQTQDEGSDDPEGKGLRNTHMVLRREGGLAEKGG